MEDTNLTPDQVDEIGHKVVKRKRAPRPEQTVQTAPGENTRYINHSLQLYKLGKVDMSDPVAVENRVGEYFTICAQNDMKPSVAGLALALGIDRVSVYKYREGIYGKSQDVSNTLKRACSFLDAQMNDYMQNGKINPVAGIFLLKNSYGGYTDKQEVVVTPSAPLGDQSDDGKLAERYNAAIVVDDFDDVSDGTKD